MPQRSTSKTEEELAELRAFDSRNSTSAPNRATTPPSNESQKAPPLMTMFGPPKRPARPTSNKAHLPFGCRRHQTLPRTCPGLSPSGLRNGPRILSASATLFPTRPRTTHEKGRFRHPDIMGLMKEPEHLRAEHPQQSDFPNKPRFQLSSHRRNPPHDKEEMATIDKALSGAIPLRPEWLRGYKCSYFPFSLPAAQNSRLRCSPFQYHRRRAPSSYAECFPHIVSGLAIPTSISTATPSMRPVPEPTPKTFKTSSMWSFSRLRYRRNYPTQTDEFYRSILTKSSRKNTTSANPKKMSATTTAARVIFSARETSPHAPDSERVPRNLSRSTTRTCFTEDLYDKLLVIMTMGGNDINVITQNVVQQKPQDDIWQTAQDTVKHIEDGMAWLKDPKFTKESILSSPTSTSLPTAPEMPQHAHSPMLSTSMWMWTTLPRRGHHVARKRIFRGCQTIQHRHVVPTRKLLRSWLPS